MRKQRVSQLTNLIILMLVLSSCKSHKSMMKEMENEIPNAVKFVEEHEESIAVLLDIQSRLENRTCVIYREYYLRIYEYVPNGIDKFICIESFDESVFINDNEKIAIQCIFDIVPSSGYFIEITPELIQIMYMETNQGKKVVDLYIYSGADDNHIADNSIIYETVNDTWTIIVTMWRRN